MSIIILACFTASRQKYTFNSRKAVGYNAGFSEQTYNFTAF